MREYGQGGPVHRAIDIVAFTDDANLDCDGSMSDSYPEHRSGVQLTSKRQDRVAKPGGGVPFYPLGTGACLSVSTLTVLGLVHLVD